MKNIHIFLSVLMLALIVVPAVARSGAPPATPIDGGLSLLLAAGAGLGLKKIMGKKEK